MPGARNVTKATDTQLNRRQQFEIIRFRNHFTEIRRERDVVADRFRDATRSVILQRQPNLERPETTRQFNAVIPESKSLFIAVSVRLDVVRVFGAEGGLALRANRGKKTTGIDRNVKPLVRIE